MKRKRYVNVAEFLIIKLTHLILYITIINHNLNQTTLKRRLQLIINVLLSFVNEKQAF
jgi:hypothetical protein